MNITTDTDGEVVAFGVTVPAPTPSMFHDILKQNCDTLAQKLVAKVEDDDAYNGKCILLAIPIPVQYQPEDSYFSVQHIALKTALELTGALQMRGYTVLSCTPAAMTDTQAGVDGVAVGYILSVTHNRNVQEVLADNDEYPMACAWTEQAMNTYGKAAVSRALESILAGNSPTSVH